MDSPATAPIDLQDSPEKTYLQDSSSIAIEGIDEPIVIKYFENLNSGKYQETSELFAIDGILHPPFESAIVGREEIAAYLQKEALGLVLHPKQGMCEISEKGFVEYQVVGKVQTPFFIVNVSWQFTFNSRNEISFAKVKLLASLQELFNLRQQQEP
jgi:hypothetical protein